MWDPSETGATGRHRIGLQDRQSPGSSIDELPHATAAVPRLEVLSEPDTSFERFVRDAASVAYSTGVGQPTHEIYVVLASELKKRGIYPDPEAVLEAAMLISRGKKPAVLRG